MKTTKVIKYGSSLPVPCVQELAKQPLDAIPPRYIQHKQEEEEEESTLSISSDDDPSVSQIPVIDLESLLLQDSELLKLDLACRQWGFFQLINHGVSTLLLKKVKTDIQDLFNLPMEDKKKLWQLPGELEGFGQAFVVSDDQKLDWGDLFFMTTLPVHLRKPHLFPNLPLPLRYTLEMYSIELRNVAMKVLGMMGKALRMRDGEMEEIFGEGNQGMRMNYYPPCPQPEKVIGLTPHSDSVGLTILLQLNDVEGLQIKKQGTWVPVKPLPDAFIINVGDILEIISNGSYRSIEHRATVNSERQRLSIATFFSPRHDGEVGPAPSLVSEQSPPLFKRVSMEEYLIDLFSRKLDGKSYLDAMRINHNQA